MNENQSMSAIAEFPLIWRWTSAAHASFSESELAGLRPCSRTEAARIHDDSHSFDLRDGLDKRHFINVRVQSADISILDGCSWLRAQAPNLAEQVTVSWERDTALRTGWEFFTGHWDDFCYPLSDDVLVLPDSGRWVLRYHHDEIFYFGDRNA
jgi:hypothetical protein